MKVLFIGDMHLKISKFEQSKQLLDWINSIILEYKPDIVVNLGDTFDTHAVIRSEILNEFIEHVKCNIHVPYIYVLGNHDMFRPNDSTYHALKPFHELIDNFIIVDKPMDIYDMTFIPYTHDHTKFPTKSKAICIAHQTFVGADYGYYRPDVGVDADALPAKLIVSGHIHKRQQFGKVVYVGTPIAHDANDVDQVKGLSLLDTDTLSWEFIQSPFPMWRSRKLEISEDVSIEDVHHELEQLNKNDYWIVDIAGSKSDINRYLSSDRFVQLQRDLHIRVRPQYTDTSKIIRKQIKATSIISILDEYIDNIYSGSVSRDKLKSIFRQVIDTTPKT